MTDLALAIAHHIAVFGLVMMLATEAGALRADRPNAELLARLDAGYGGASIAVLAIGAARVAWGAKGWTFYSENPYFWLKMGAFLLVGLASVPPTRIFLRWRRKLRADAAAVPPEAEVARMRLWVRAEMGLVLVIVTAAAAMARWPF
jgi:putative membrane protein